MQLLRVEAQVRMGQGASEPSRRGEQLARQVGGTSLQGKRLRESIPVLPPPTILSAPGALETLTPQRLPNPCLFPKTPTSRISVATSTVVWESRLSERVPTHVCACVCARACVCACVRMGVKTLLLLVLPSERGQTFPAPPWLPHCISPPCQPSWGAFSSGQLWRGLVSLRGTGFSLPPLAHTESRGLAWARERVWCGGVAGIVRLVTGWPAKCCPGPSSPRLPNSHPTLPPAWGSGDTQPLLSAQVMAGLAGVFHVPLLVLCQLARELLPHTETRRGRAPGGTPPHPPAVILLGNEGRRCQSVSCPSSAPSPPPTSSQVSDLLPELWSPFYGP